MLHLITDLVYAHIAVIGKFTCRTHLKKLHYNLPGISTRNHICGKFHLNVTHQLSLAYIKDIPDDLRNGKTPVLEHRIERNYPRPACGYTWKHAVILHTEC